MKDLMSFFGEKRDVVTDIKKRGRKRKSKHTKSKYALILEDDFGYRRTEYYICTEREIQRILFKKYTFLKMKSVGDNFSEKKKNKFLEEEEKKNYIVVKPKEVYKVRLNVGFILFHTLFYEKLVDDATHTTVKMDMHTSYHLGYFNRADASKIMRKTVSNDFKQLCSDIEDEEDKEDCAIKKVFFGKSIQMRFNYWYRCSYEYDEWDISSIIINAKNIKFKRR